MVGIWRKYRLFSKRKGKSLEKDDVEEESFRQRMKVKNEQLVMNCNIYVRIRIRCTMIN